MGFFIFLSQKIDLIFFILLFKVFEKMMEEKHSTFIICFNCMKKYNSITYRAFDQNFCSRTCMNLSIEINNLFDYGFNDPNKWVKKSSDILEAKKKLEFKNHQSICKSVLEELMIKVVDNKFKQMHSKSIVAIPKDSLINLEPKNIITPPFDIKKDDKSKIQYYYTTPFNSKCNNSKTLEKTSNLKKNIRYNCNLETLFSKFTWDNLKFPILNPNNYNTLCSGVLFQEWMIQ